MGWAGRIHEICGDRKFRDELTDTLFRLVETDTSPTARIPVIRENEKKCFKLISDYIGKLRPGSSRFSEEPVTPEVESHKAFTRPYYAATEEFPGGAPLEKVYEGRYNLLYMIDNEEEPGGRNTAVNAHIDVVSPFFPPKIENDCLYGRGACDDKANVAVMLGALRVLAILEKEKILRLKNKITAMFVIDEETGGNGSLSITMNKELRKRYESILVLEACDNNIHPANRGAVWFKCSLKKAPSNRVHSLTEAMSRVVLRMQDEGEKIKSESEHPLFPHRPVQTCNGILGPFGEHPSRICGRVSFKVKAKNGGLPEGLEKAADEGLRLFTEKFGDKTRIKDKNTGQPKVPRHIDFRKKGGSALITVYGSTGHMGAILENDDAILKWAYVMREFKKLEDGRALEFELEGSDTGSELVLEGGQGFIPTHSIEQVQDRMRRAAERGIKEYLEISGSGQPGITSEISYDKLHNSAFDGDPESETFQNALRAGVSARIVPEDYRARGWDVSCDARLFAEPGIPVITSGIGTLSSAHSNGEYVLIRDIFPMVAFTALFLIAETGSVRT